jgi:hypothetical protein
VQRVATCRNARRFIVNQRDRSGTERRQPVANGFILLYHETSRCIMMEMVMTITVREKFSSQAAPEVLAALRQIAESQGRQFQSVLDDALRDYIDRQQKERPRRHVMASFASSLDEFDSLYRELAK